jgi:hypothetical protein
MTVNVYSPDGKVEEYPNAHLDWEWGDDEERADSGYHIHSMDRNFTSVSAFVYPSECTKIEITSEESDKVFKSPPIEGLISGKLYRIFSEISRERKRQDEKRGEQNHPMLSAYEDLESIRARLHEFRALNEDKDYRCWLTILQEEIGEAFAETDPEKQREKMVQVAAVAVQIIEYLDRRMEAEEKSH